MYMIDTRWAKCYYIGVGKVTTSKAVRDESTTSRATYIISVKGHPVAQCMPSNVDGKQSFVNFILMRFNVSRQATRLSYHVAECKSRGYLIGTSRSLERAGSDSLLQVIQNMDHLE